MTFLGTGKMTTYTHIIPRRRARVQQHYMFLKVNPSQTYGYVFADSFMLAFRTLDFIIVINHTVPADSIFILQPRAVDITETYAILVGFHLDYKPESSVYAAALVSLNSLKPRATAFLGGNIQATAKVLPYSRDNDMSVAINPKHQIAIIGLPALNKVVLLNINADEPSFQNSTLQVTRTEDGPGYVTGFGRSVAWIDDKTVAISVLIVPNRPWSRSEVWVFGIDKPFKIPLFIFPNNQQKVLMPNPPLFLQTLIFSGYLYIITEQPYYMVVPSQPPGFVSMRDPLVDEYMVMFNSVTCVAGTYKNTSGFGPCTICPSLTKNAGNQSYAKCESCRTNSFCPLGSVNDISLDTYPSYEQTFSFPDTPDMNNYDDLLIQNIFTIGHSRRCIVISPIFWTIIMITLCFTVWLFMTLLKCCTCPRAHAPRNRAKQIFKRADIFNEGERWMGGLFSSAVILLFGFTIRFASEFLNLYPIETAGLSYFSCDDTIRNALFDSSLQLPLPNADGNRWTIFEMLDAQPFTMTVDLLNTAADCSSITVQHNRPGVNHVRLPFQAYVPHPDNATRSVNFSLPAHSTSVQINITGAYFVGGMRLCLYGEGRIDGMHTLQTLDMCQLFSTANQTLSFMTTLRIVMIKVINVTKPLKVGGDTRYHGRWAPTFAERSLSDELIYEQDGHYLRYMHERTVLAITLSEQPFYLQNNQQPIVRRAELAFHTLLFCTLIIELFGMGFLLFRLIILPFIRGMRCCDHRTKRNDQGNKAPLPVPTSFLPTE